MAKGLPRDTWRIKSVRIPLVERVSKIAIAAHIRESVEALK